MIRFRSNEGFSDNPVCRSIKCILAVRMLHLFFLFSLSVQLCIVALTLECVHPFSTRHCLVDAYEYRREFAQRERQIRLDVEPRRVNVIAESRDDRLDVCHDEVTPHRRSSSLHVQLTRQNPP